MAPRFSTMPDLQVAVLREFRAKDHAIAQRIAAGWRPVVRMPRPPGLPVAAVRHQRLATVSAQARLSPKCLLYNRLCERHRSASGKKLPAITTPKYATAAPPFQFSLRRPGPHTLVAPHPAGRLPRITGGLGSLCERPDGSGPKQSVPDHTGHGLLCPPSAYFAKTI